MKAFQNEMRRGIECRRMEEETSTTEQINANKNKKQ
jgi:hypothetical protein